MARSGSGDVASTAELIAELSEELLESTRSDPVMGKACNAKNCKNMADPRWYIHGPDGGALPACDGCGTQDAQVTHAHARQQKKINHQYI